MKRIFGSLGAKSVQTVGLSLAAALLCAFSDAPSADVVFEDESSFALDDSVFSSEAAAAIIGAGRASYYADKFHGRRTASGEIFDNYAMTAAHPKLPMGSLVRVTCEKSGKSVTVRVNDRGPYAHNRVIDLSKAAARELGMLNTGLADVTLELLPTT